MKLNTKLDFIRELMAGEIIAVAAGIYLQCQNKAVGAFLFAIGLLTVIRFQLRLYTGWTGIFADAMMLDRDMHHDCPWMKGWSLCNYGWRAAVLISILLTNVIGTLVVGGLIGICIPEAREAARALMEHKEEAGILAMLIKGVLCGCLMQIAFLAGKARNAEANLMVVLCIMGFILAGFEHSIADFAYAFIAWKWSWNTVMLLGAAVVGNFIGGHFTFDQLSR